MKIKSSRQKQTFDSSDDDGVQPSFRFNKFADDSDSETSEVLSDEVEDKSDVEKQETEILKTPNEDLVQDKTVKKLPQQSPKQKNNPKNKKVSNIRNEDLDDILAQLGTKEVPPIKTEVSKTQSSNEALESKQLIESKMASESIEKSEPAIDTEKQNEVEDDSKPKSKKKKAKKKGGGANAEAPKPKAMSAAARLAQQRLQLLEEERKREEEERRNQEELERKQLEEEEAKKKKEAEEKERIKRLKQERKERLRKEGKLLSASAKEKQKKNALAREQLLKSMGIQEEELEIADPSKPSRSRAVKIAKHKVKKQTQPPSNNEEVIKNNLSEICVAEVIPEITPELQENRDSESNASSWDKDVSDAEEVSAPKSTSTNTSKAKPPTKSQSMKEKNMQNKKTVNKSTDTQNDKLRSPICCVLGHVDTGKTKLLDRIRSTNIQDVEAGGITQQIGATYIPYENLKRSCEICNSSFTMKVPGLLIIDTPGHESFNNLRARGTAVCDIAILVVDIMHGLEPQTKESIDILRARKCPFLIALNKIDRLYSWKVSSKAAVTDSIDTQNISSVEKIIYSQEQFVIDEFETRLASVLLQLSELGLNASLYWKNDNPRSTVSVVPTSAITGEGLADLLYSLIKLPQTLMYKSLILDNTEIQCTVLEVKNIEGLGVTIDVILVSGTLYENQNIILCGMNGPILTTIRALLTPHPMKELRVKSEYQHHKSITAAMGIKIYAQGLDEVLAGTSLLSAENKTAAEIDLMKEEVMSDMTSIFKSVDRSGIGVYVMASTLGSLEALLIFLKESKIPVAAVNLGCINKIDVKKASIMREKQRPEYCCILAFDVKADPEAIKEAALLNVTIFQADIIYHLFDKFNKHISDYHENLKREKRAIVLFPCILSILPSYIFNKKDPLILGVRVERGFLRNGTTLCIPDKETLVLGKVQSIEHNNKPINEARKDSEVAIKIIGDSSITYGRHFDHTNKIYSRITRESIDALKQYFKDEMTPDDWRTVIDIKKVLNIT